jgi:D-alanyl-D-alanine dipeptidase
LIKNGLSKLKQMDDIEDIMNSFEHDWDAELYGFEKSFSKTLEKHSRRMMANEIKDKLREADEFLDFLEDKVMYQKYNPEYLSQIIIWAENQVQKISEHIYQQVDEHNQKYSVNIVIPAELTDFSLNFVIVRALSTSTRSFINVDDID